MATNSKPYPKTVGSLKTYADDEATYPLRALLVAGYVYDDAHEFADDITDELSGSGYARVDLDNVLYTATDSDAAITADDVVFASLTATDIDGVIVISDQGADSASPLVGYYAIGPLSVSTETLTVPWPSGQVAYFTTRDALTGEGIVQTIVAGDNITVDDTDPANPVVSATGGGSSGPLDAEQFDRTSTTPGAISVDLSSVTKAGAAIFVDGASDVTITDLPASSDFPAFFVYVARTSGTGVCTLTFDGGAPVYDGDQYTATSEANGQAAIGLVPLGSGENWLVDSVFPAAGGSGPDLSDADPEDLGTADSGTSPDASRADHVHATEVGDAIADGVTDLAPSQNAVYDALALKAPIANAVHTGTFEVPTAKHTGNTGASTTPLLITGANASGAPASGAHVKGEIAGDDTGKLWYCTVAGTPGTWVQIGGEQAYQPPLISGTRQLGLPGVQWLGQAFTTIAANIVYYTPFKLDFPINVDRLGLDVAVAASGKFFQQGVYSADLDWQPTGSVLATGGAVSTASTGMQLQTVSVTLQPGRYLMALISDGTPGIRWSSGQTITGFGDAGHPSGGALNIRSHWRRSQTYGALPSSPSAWDTTTDAAGALFLQQWLRWTV